MIRIASVGDVHYDAQSRERLRSHFLNLGDQADLLFIAGDLTQHGALDEAAALAYDLAKLPVPVVVVLGNHDYHLGEEELIRKLLQEKGVIVLEGQSTRFDIRGHSVGVSGLKGFGGGFFGACVTEFGEPETKAFARHGRLQAEILKKELLSLDTDFRFALTHFSPIEGTLLGERREIFPFLGSYLLAEVIDEAQVDGAFHGHAHMGTEKGMTPGGVPVRNVALNVIRHAYNIYSFESPRRVVVSLGVRSRDVVASESDSSRI
jgi:Icc-related predicted phosphoesterase